MLLIAHNGSLSKLHLNYNGLPYNLRIEWENEEIANELLSIIVADNLISCTIYTQDCNLLDKAN